MMDDDAMKIVGMDRESSQQDLFNAIKRGEHPRWTMQIQVLRKTRRQNCPTTPLTSPRYAGRHKDAPLMDVGYFQLNRNPDNYFNEVEQVAMNPASVVPGIGFSPDKMLQAACSPMAMPIATAWASTITRFPAAGALPTAQRG